MKILSMEAELLHWTKGRTDGQTDRQTDRQTDIMKLIVDFRNLGVCRKTSLTLYKLTKSNLTKLNFTVFYHINFSPNYIKELSAYLSDIEACTNPLIFPRIYKKTGYQNQCCDTLFAAVFGLSDRLSSRLQHAVPEVLK